MKKILSILISAIILTISLSALTACEISDNSENYNDNSSTITNDSSSTTDKPDDNEKSEVTLMGLSATPSYNTRYKRNKQDIATYDGNNLEMPESTYTFIYKSQTEIYLDIILDNPQNYYIMDFKLTSESQTIQYYDEKMEKWNYINNIWIRWSGSNNQESRYKLRLPSPEISPDKIHISELYYSDRYDKFNRIAVNMNDKETYSIYKVEEGLLETKTVKNTLAAYQFEVVKKEGVTVTKVTNRTDIAEIELTAEVDGTYKMTESGYLTIEYEKAVENVVYKGVYHKRITKLHLISTKKNYTWNAMFNNYGHNFHLMYLYEGTDVEKELHYIENEQLWEGQKELTYSTVRKDASLYGVWGRRDDGVWEIDFSTREKCIEFLQNTYWVLGEDRICLYDIVGENFELLLTVEDESKYF